MHYIGTGLAWLGFWLMIGLANFGESPCDIYEITKQKTGLYYEDNNKAEE